MYLYIVHVHYTCTHVHCIPFPFIIAECSVIFFTSLRLEGQVSEITCQNGRALEIETSSCLYKQRPLRGEEKKKNGKRYHNLPENVFVIADDEEEEGEKEEDGGDESELVNISLYSTSPEMIHSFPCSEVTSNGHLVTR